jgi:hypothetical protein
VLTLAGRDTNGIAYTGRLTVAAPRALAAR